MADTNETVFFIDDDLVERLMRGDTAPSDQTSATKKKRPAEVNALAAAVKLASDGKLDEAVKDLERAESQGENPVEVQTGLGHLRFEQQKWDEAAGSYSQVVELEPKHRTAHYNLGLTLRWREKFAEDASRFRPRSPSIRSAGRRRSASCSSRNPPAFSKISRLTDRPNQDRAHFGKASRCISFDGRRTASFIANCCRQFQLSRASGESDRAVNRLRTAR